MNLLLLGLNHRTAPVEVRERLAFSREGAATALMLFKSRFPAAEAAIISTCNRVEFLVNSDAGSLEVEQMLTFLSDARDVPVRLFEPHLYRLEGRSVITHLFRVISGLDSMVLGEYQVVNQLKQAYQLAHERGTAGPVVHRLFHHAFGVSKRVRTETAIGDGRTSIPSVAVEVIRRAVPDFADRRILIVGAGEMAQLTAEYLRQADARRFTVTTRTLLNAKALAQVCNGHAVPFNELDDQLASADIVITATNCPTAILTAERIGRCCRLRRGRPLLLIDLAVPRNIEPEAAGLPGVSLHDVDSLGRLVAQSWRQRSSQVEVCESIIDEEAEAFEQWVQESRVRPLIEQMFQDVRALADIEVRAFFRRCPELSDGQRDAVVQLTERLVAKLMHPCVSTMRQEKISFSTLRLAEAFRTIRIKLADSPAGAQLRNGQSDDAFGRALSGSVCN